MIIYFDIDGTLIDEETHELPKSAAEAIQKARQNGHICMINTGRSNKLVEIEKTRLPEFDGFLMGCGTEIVYKGETLLHRTFSAEESKRIIEGLAKYEIDAVLEGHENNYRQDYDKIHDSNFLKFMRQFEPLHFGLYQDAIGRFDKFYCFVHHKEQMEGFVTEYGQNLEVVDRKKGFFEIMPKGSTKASGMAYMAEYLHISISESVAIGDSSNDIPMIEAAGTGIAMGNATDDVKAIADYVTTDIRENGIENALKQIGAI